MGSSGEYGKLPSPHNEKNLLTPTLFMGSQNT